METPTCKNGAVQLMANINMQSDPMSVANPILKAIHWEMNSSKELIGAQILVVTRRSQLFATAVEWRMNTNERGRVQNERQGEKKCDEDTYQEAEKSRRECRAHENGRRLQTLATNSAGMH